MAKDPTDNTTIPSGFRPYPTQGFQIQPQANYWQDGNFYIPGINQAGPSMTTSLGSMFPSLQHFLSVASPPRPDFMGQAAPFVGAMTPSSIANQVTGRNRVKQPKRFGLFSDPTGDQ